MPATRNLENIDETARTLCLSPRSETACKIQGIDPEELLVKSMGYFQEKLTPVKLAIPNYAEKLFRHAEGKRKAKLKLVRDQRKKLISGGGEALGLRPDDEGSVMAAAQKKTMARLKEEEKALEKMKRRQLKKLRTMMAAEVRRSNTETKFRARLQKRAQKEQEEKEQSLLLLEENRQHLETARLQLLRQQQRDRVEMRRKAHEAFEETQRKLEQRRLQQEEARQQATEASQAREARANERKRHLESIQRAQQQATAARELQLARKEEERLRQLSLSQAEEAAVKEEQKKKERRRYEAASLKQQLLEEQRRKEFSFKEHEDQQRLVNFQEKQRRQRELLANEAEANTLRIQRAKDEADRVAENKKNRTLRKDEQHREWWARMAELRQQKEQQQNEKEEAKETRRLKAAKQAKDLEEIRIENVKAKELERNARHHAQRILREEQMAEQKLRQELTLLDRKEHVLRMKKIKQFKRDQVMLKVREDALRVQALKDQQEVARERRRAMREEHDELTKTVLNSFAKLKDTGKLAEMDPSDISIDKLEYLMRTESPSKLIPRPPTSARSKSAWGNRDGRIKPNVKPSEKPLVKPGVSG